MTHVHPKQAAFDRTWQARLSCLLANRWCQQKALAKLSRAKNAMIEAYGGFTPEYVSAWAQLQRETDFAVIEIAMSKIRKEVDSHAN